MDKVTSYLIDRIQELEREKESLIRLAMKPIDPDAKDTFQHGIIEAIQIIESNCEAYKYKGQHSLIDYSSVVAESIKELSLLKDKGA